MIDRHLSLYDRMELYSNSYTQVSPRSLSFQPHESQCFLSLAICLSLSVRLFLCLCFLSYAVVQVASTSLYYWLEVFFHVCYQRPGLLVFTCCMPVRVYVSNGDCHLACQP